MEYEYCLLGYQNKCTTEWGLLSFIHMQSQSNEHPLHNPSRTWPSLKALHQCALFYPNTALKNPLILHWTQLIGSPSSFCSMYTSSVAITYDYSFAWQRVKGALQMSVVKLLTETNLWLPRSDLDHDVICRRLASWSLCSDRRAVWKFSRLIFDEWWCDSSIRHAVYFSWYVPISVNQRF